MFTKETLKLISQYNSLRNACIYKDELLKNATSIVSSQELII